MERDLFAPDHRHIFDEQSDDALPVTVFGSGVFPEPRKVVGQSKDCRSLFIVEYPAVLFATLFVLMLSLAQSSQFLIPAGFQRIGNESVFGIKCY